MEVQSQLKEKYSNYYNNESSRWRMLGAKAKVENILSLLPKTGINNLVEVGAGDGSIIALLSEKNVTNELYALEISQSGIERLNEKKINALVEARLFDGYKIPYPDKFFDIAICTHVMEHVEHPRVLLREIKRISKQQIFEIPIDFSFNVDKKAAHFLSYGHIDIYTPAQFRFLLLSENFKILTDKNSMYNLETLFFGSSVTKKLLSFIKWCIWNTVTPLRKIKPNAYTVLTE